MEEDSAELKAFVHSSWADNLETYRSTTGILIYMDRHLIYWSSKRQSIISHRTVEAEYIAADSAARMIIWLRLIPG